MRQGELLDGAFARLAEQVPTRDRAWAQELVYGTMRLRGRIDFLLAQFVQRGLPALEPDVLDILRLGAYQLLEMNAVPAYAAISQSVEMTKSVAGRGATGLVNGVLQSFRRGEEELQPPPGRDAAHYLSSWGSHPRWLVERWLAAYGRTQTEALIDYNNRRPDVFLRPVRVQRDEAIARLRSTELDAEPVPTAPDSVRIASSQVGEALAAVPAVVQDPAGSLVVRYAAFAAEVVADLCAAPGGKALAVSGGSGESWPSYVLAADLSFRRLLKVRENTTRTGTANVGFVVADARTPPLRQVPQVLIDVPCTGTGTLRRHPDGKWRITPDDLTALVQLQHEILTAAAACVAPGGLLVYATCALEPEENEQQVARFLYERADFQLEPPSEFDQTFLDDGFLRVLPQRHGFDGAYAARLRRAA